MVPGMLDHSDGVAPLAGLQSVDDGHGTGDAQNERLTALASNTYR